MVLLLSFSLPGEPTPTGAFHRQSPVLSTEPRQLQRFRVPVPDLTWRGGISARLPRVLSDLRAEGSVD